MGSEFYHDPYEDGCPSDWWRVDTVAELIDAEFANRILFSQDVYSKFRRRKYGGAGYAHILDYGIPMLARSAVVH